MRIKEFCSVAAKFGNKKGYKWKNNGSRDQVYETNDEIHQIGLEEERRNPGGAGSRVNNNESKGLSEEGERPCRINTRVSLTKKSTPPGKRSRGCPLKWLTGTSSSSLQSQESTTGKFNDDDAFIDSHKPSYTGKKILDQRPSRVSSINSAFDVSNCRCMRSASFLRSTVTSKIEIISRKLYYR